MDTLKVIIQTVGVADGREGAVDKKTKTKIQLHPSTFTFAIGYPPISSSLTRHVFLSFFINYPFPCLTNTGRERLKSDAKGR